MLVSLFTNVITTNYYFVTDRRTALSYRPIQPFHPIQNNLVRIIMPIIIKTTGKNIIINIPGIIRKWGKIIIIRRTKKSAPINFRPNINTIPSNTINNGTNADADQLARLPKRWPIPPKKSPIPGRLISQPLLLKSHIIPKMISTQAQNDPELFLCSYCFSMTSIFDDVKVIQHKRELYHSSVSKSLKSANGFFTRWNKHFCVSAIKLEWRKSRPPGLTILILHLCMFVWNHWS